MNRELALALLRTRKEILKQRFGISEMALFGSFARDQADDGSDVDVLVSFDSPPDWKRYFGAQEYLEDLFGRPVDLAMDTDIRAEIRPYVEREPSMSDDASEPREWRFHIRDMITFSENVLSYSSGMNQDEFLADNITYDATLRNLELIGEAATHIPSEVREAHQEVPWRAIIGTRNRLAHGYLSIDNRIIWSVIREAVPALLPALRRLLAETEKDQP